MAKQRFFVRIGIFLRGNPFIAGFLGLISTIIALSLLREEGVLFIVGFCLMALALTDFYIMYRTIRRGR